MWVAGIPLRHDKWELALFHNMPLRTLQERTPRSAGTVSVCWECARGKGH